MVDKLRDELELFIDLYGRLDPRTVAKSQELDLEIVREMRG